MAQSEQQAEIERRRVIIVTGMSGAGKSQALYAFEDLGFQTVDNLPLSMVSDLLDRTAEQAHVPLAIGVDSRTLHFSPDALESLVEDLRQQDGVRLHVLLMDASDDTLIQRYSETRRRHPLAMGQPVRRAISEERNLIADVRRSVDAILDTSRRTSAETRRVIIKRYGTEAGPRLVVSVMSFGFAHGVPRDADLVFDVRFLRNPHYEPDLKPHTGQNEKVANFVRADEAFQPFVEKLSGLISLLMPRYILEGKSYLTLAFGCTGGKHRSVMMAETFADLMRGSGQPATLYHRDIPADT